MMGLFAVITGDDLELPTPVRDRFDFMGWYEDGVLVTKFELRNYNLVAQWERTSLLEIYEENGIRYINVGRYPQSVVTDEATITALSAFFMLKAWRTANRFEFFANFLVKFSSPVLPKATPP